MKKILIVIASATLASAAWAVDFTDLDTDGDGVLSVDESAIVEGLDPIAADTNADGVISVEEYEAATVVPAEDAMPEATDEAPLTDEMAVPEEAPLVDEEAPAEEAPVL